MKKFLFAPMGLLLLLAACGSPSDNAPEAPTVSLSATETLLIPSIDTKKVETDVKITPVSSVAYLLISKVGADAYTLKIEGAELKDVYHFSYTLTAKDPDLFNFSVVAYLKDGSQTHPLSLKIDNRKGIFVNKVTRIARLTGNAMGGERFPSPNQTAQKWNVGGTDLGIIWELTPGRYGLFFGDTFGSDFAPNHQKPGPNGGSWRSNVLAFSEDGQLEDGITFSEMAVDTKGRAREIVFGGKDGSGNGNWTSIPTGAIRANNVDYVHYMNIRNWTGWITNHSGLYKSTNDGKTWSRCGNVNFAATSKFGQVGYFKKDGYVYMIGTPPGRNGSACLARIAEADMENQSNYEYWNGNDQQWIKGEEDKATVIISGTVGELSFIYNESFKKWIIAYFNSDKYNITMRSADNITGPWSAPVELAAGTQYAQLYGSFFHPLSVRGRNLYFTMSMWLPYNVFLMKVELGGMGAR